MKTNHKANICRAILLVFCIFLFAAENAAAGLKVSFQYMLSNFSGTVPSQWAKLAIDKERNEVYAFNSSENDVRIFNKQGMELFSFGEEGEVANARDISLGEDGSIYMLINGYTGNTIKKLNYRGEPENEISFNNLPEDLQGFRARRLEYKNGRFYLVDADALKIITVTEEGRLLESYALRNRLEIDADKTDSQGSKEKEVDISGFSVDAAGNMYFTVPALFTAYRLSADDELDSFGKAGSAPGSFGVVSGIASDTAGNIFVADRLRSVVIVFDRNFKFQGEFGYRGSRPGNLIVPDDLVVDETLGNVYVAQAANKGVAAYKVSFDTPPKKFSNTH